MTDGAEDGAFHMPEPVDIGSLKTASSVAETTTDRVILESITSLIMELAETNEHLGRLYSLIDHMFTYQMDKDEAYAKHHGIKHWWVSVDDLQKTEGQGQEEPPQ